MNNPSQQQTHCPTQPCLPFFAHCYIISSRFAAAVSIQILTLRSESILDLYSPTYVFYNINLTSCCLHALPFLLTPSVHSPPDLLALLPFQYPKSEGPPHPLFSPFLPSVLHCTVVYPGGILPKHWHTLYEI